tara:strand:+ start:128 stop:325 length:198 start_codon:yes stop_codon:yes gene_type:complete
MEKRPSHKRIISGSIPDGPTKAELLDRDIQLGIEWIDLAIKETGLDQDPQWVGAADQAKAIFRGE